MGSDPVVQQLMRILEGRMFRRVLRHLLLLLLPRPAEAIVQQVTMRTRQVDSASAQSSTLLRDNATIVGQLSLTSVAPGWDVVSVVVVVKQQQCLARVVHVW